ncbi:DNA repair and recombination protein Rdh54p [Monosporozyma unispora]
MLPLPKYENKPFKPPRRLGSSGSTNAVTKVAPKPIIKRAPISTPTASSSRAITKQLNTNTTSTSSNIFQNIQCFTMMYRKPSNKKVKTWSGDGYAIYKKIPQPKLVFYNDSGQYMSSSSVTQWDDSEIFDTLFKSKGMEFQLDYKLIKDDELTDLQQLLTGKPVSEDNTNNKINLVKKKSPTPTSTAPKTNIPVSQLFQKNTTKSFKSVLTKSEIYTPLSLRADKRQQTLVNKIHYKPIFDVSKIQDPIVMNKSKDADVDVIVDPLLGKSLRQHQREGVKFIYDCVMGLEQPTSGTIPIHKGLLLESDSDISGCLLADDMGLGKTLMTITIIWTLLKQTPFASKVECSQSGVPLRGLCKKVLIVCPVTLIGNWVREFQKWLGLNRIGVLTLHSSNTPDMDKNSVKNFLRVQRSYQVLIVGYEKLLNLSDELQSKQVSAMDIDLLVCDEGHRLKNSSSKILNVLKNLDIPKKVLLSGTPIQNDLTEFYTIVDFINPGIFGAFPNFKRRFINPILKARDTSNSYNEDIQELGEDRSKELIEVTKRFTLRRTNDILNKYLPPKTDLIIFCKPTKTQLCAFYDILQQTELDFSHMTANSSLGLITLMKKICNSPSLLNNDSYYNSNIKDNRIKTKYGNIIDSGKLKVLISLLDNIRKEAPDEKVVIVSNYTQSLDIIQNNLVSQQMTLTRLDGSTPQKQRDSIVNNFNRNRSVFAFLLSAKSGGVGLNLIGASRLILFDNDWNPSVDLQAMSRIHRQGQKKHCYIYRLVTTGCIDEKILQRQLMKHSLSQKFLDSASAKTNSKDDLFSKEDLKDLFTILTDSKCNTHDLICSCKGDGERVMDISNDEDSEIATTICADHNQNKMQLSQWTNGLDAKRIIEDIETKEKKKQTKFIKKCLIGYQHIDPTLTLEGSDIDTSNSLVEVNKTVSFMFVKPGSIFDDDEDAIPI